MGVLAQLATDQLGAAQHVAPLVVAAELHVAAVVLEQVVEVVGLHGHVVELQEAQALLHALLEALGPQHVVDGEAGTDVPDEVHIVQVQQPVGVVDHLGLALAEVDEPGHLLLEAVAVVLDSLLGHHGAHVGAAGGVADHGGAAADQSNGLVAGHLQPFHQAQGHEVAHVEGIGSGVKANIEGGLAVVHQLPDLVLVGHLGDQAAGNQFFVNLHGSLSCSAIFTETGKIEAPVPVGTEGEMLSRYHLWFAAPSRKRPHGVPAHSRAVTGAPGARLLSLEKTVGVPAPRCIRRASLSPFHRPGAL